MLDGLAETLPALDARCVVLTGDGDVFSAGYDIGDLSPERLAEEAAELLTHPFEAALAALDAVAVPVVAALGGHAFGGGLELALACDLRDLRARRAARDAAGAPRRRLLAHRPAALRRRDRRRPHARAVPHRAAGRRGGGAGVGPRERGRRGRGGALASRWRREIAALSPLSLRGNKRVLHALIPPLDPALEAELHALRDAGLPLRGLRRGRPRLHRETRTALARPLSRPGRAVPSGQSPLDTRAGGGPGRILDAGSRGPPGRAESARSAPAHADGLRTAGPARGAGRAAGAAAVLGQRARARGSSEGAPGGGGRGDALGRRRGRGARVVRDDDAAPPARGAARDLHRPARGAALRLAARWPTWA